MKLISILLFSFCISVHATGNAQGITLTVENSPVEAVFKQIEKQSGYVFFYPYSSLKEASPVTLSVRNASVKEVLELCFKGQPFTYVIKQKTVVVTKRFENAGTVKETSQAQITVKGRVVNEQGHAIEGVTVTLRGTNKSTATDSDGSFVLQDVPEDGSLIFTSITYETREVRLRGKTDVVVTLKIKISSMANVAVEVSTGYQQIPKERATGSFTQIDNKTLNEQVSTDLLSRLEAVTNGLIVDRTTSSTPRIMIRGLSTIQGPREALIVVDNFPYEGDLNNINPNDVESITILRDAAAASIWGARAGNGVIVISTKKGRFNQPLTVEFNANMTIGEKPDLFQLRLISTSEYIDLESFLFDKGYYNNTLNSTSRTAVTPVVEILLKKKNGIITAAEANNQMNALRDIDVRNDFNKYLYRQSVNQQYALNLRGGNAIHSWAMFTGFDKNQTSLDAGYSRLNLRFRNTVKPATNLELTADLAFTQNLTRSGKPGYGDIDYYLGRLYPYARFADDAGNSLPIIKNYRQGYIDTAGKGMLLDWNYYPLEDYKHTPATSDQQSIVGTFGMEYKIVKGLSAGLKYQFEKQHRLTNSLFEEESYSMRSLINYYSQIDWSNGKVNYAVPRGGMLSLANDNVLAQNLRGQFGFNHQWGQHRIDALAGGEIRNVQRTGDKRNTYGYNNDLLTWSDVDFTRPYPTYITGYNSYINNFEYLEDYLNRFVSGFANAAYNFRNKYTLSLSGRRDASNLFGVNANEKWKPLWSAGISWDISAEDFYKIAYLPYLKIRATHGYSGNMDPSKAAMTTLSYVSSTSPYTMTSWANFSNYANPDLKWETAGMTNIGIDFRTGNNRISGSVEYYRKKGTDLFGWETIDYTGGIGSRVVKNVASMKGTGWDIELQSLNIRTKDFQWQSVLNFSTYRDRVTDYYLTSLRASNFLRPQPYISGEIGKPVYAIFSYKWAGLNPQTGDPMGYLDHSTSKDYTALTGASTLISDLNYHGSAIPTVFGSVGNNLRFKNFSVSMRVNYKMGYYFRRTSVEYNSLFSGSFSHSDYSQRWQNPGDELYTNVPSMVYPSNTNRNNFYRYAEVLVEKGDHVRLQYINAGYELSREQQSWLPFRRMQLYVNISNLGLLWAANDAGIDPDYNYSFNSLVPPRTYSFGVKTVF